MSGRWSRVIRDPIHNLIPFHDTPCDRLLLELIDTREFQRLRRIKQMGFSDLVFPGATHTRFNHSIGVLQVARNFLDQIDRVTGQPLSLEQRALVLSASLLHDVGHGPFSHAFEGVTGQLHESRTLEIIGEPTTEVHQRLRQFDPTLPDKVALFLDDDSDEAKLLVTLPVYLKPVVSSQLDADRCDYLLRDSYATGTNYGQYDLDWITAQLAPQADGRRLVLSHKALSAAEAYLFARYHMYRTIYFHKTGRSAELMLKLLFRRFKELVGGSDSVEKRNQVVPEVPRALLAAFSGPMSLPQYLLLDDHTITEFLKACVLCSDPILQNLSHGLLNRRLYKATDVTDVVAAGEVQRIVAFDQAVRERMTELGMDPRYCLADDTASDLPYKPYDPDTEKPARQIYVENRAGVPVEISTISEPLTQIRKKYALVRYYFPPAFRADADRIAAATLHRSPG